jgi:putative N6-adenine-specific DNA methylase
MASQPPLSLVATTFNGLEAVLAEELRSLGAGSIRPLRRAVTFTGDTSLLYRANLWLRTALRIVKSIHTFTARDEQGLYRGVQQVDWSSLMGVDDTLAVACTASSTYFTHSKYAALKTKDAIVDQFRSRSGRRPSVDVNDPTLRISLHIHADHCTLSLDSSGDSLHRRGYRLSQTEAPLNEVVAAGMVLMTGWRGERPFVDPMCGSGTLPLEAAMIAANVAPGLLRSSFAFARWKDFDDALWRGALYDARLCRKPGSVPIFGFDNSAHALGAAAENCQRAGLTDVVRFGKAAFEELEAPAPNGILVMNPPYGERMAVDDMQAFGRMIGTRFKRAFAGYQAWVISANPELFSHVGLKASRNFKLENGGLECRFCGYQMYAGHVQKR